METVVHETDVADNGGRRRIRDRRILLSVPDGKERRTHWERRSGYDRRLRPIPTWTNGRRVIEMVRAGQG